VTTSDLYALSPFIIIAASPILIMLVISIYRNHLLTAILTSLGFILASYSAYAISAMVPWKVGGLLVIDQYALFYMGLIFSASFVITLLSYGYLKGREGNLEEYYLLLLTATLGSSILVASNHFITLFLGLEVLSVSLYALIAYVRTGEQGIEAGIKYLILAAASSAFLLFGIALLYAQLGSMQFDELGSKLLASDATRILVMAGFSLLVVGVGFKLAVVPFHMWTPDVYEGAPAPVTAYIASVSKGGMFALLLRFFFAVDGYSYPSLLLIFTIIAIASMFTGNFLALMQNNVKRILAYSSIAHLGYLLVAFIAGGKMAIEAVTFYLIAYFITTIGSFGIVGILANNETEADNVEDYRGLFWRRPWIATVFTGMLLSLAGIPLTAGFVGKFYVLSVGVGSTLWLLVVMLAVNSAIGLYYYIRIIVVMYSERDEAAEVAPSIPTFALGGGIILAILLLLLVWFGVFPAGIMGIIKSMALSLG
jgi:NADH-quinone oxidoreductase subunit N